MNDLYNKSTIETDFQILAHNLTLTSLGMASQTISSKLHRKTRLANGVSNRLLSNADVREVKPSPKQTTSGETTEGLRI